MHKKLKFAFLLCGTALCLATALHAQLVPGLYESRYQARPVTGNTYPAPTDARIVSAPYGANAWGSAVGQQNYFATVPGPNDTVVTNWPPPAELYPAYTGNTTFRYAGYINIPELPGAVSFYANFDTGKRLRLDDVVIFNEPGYQRGGFATVTIPAGWHKFDVWFEDDGGGYGPAWGDAHHLGFGIDWNGGASYVHDNFVFPEDPGDGSLFAADFPPGGAILFSKTATDVLDTSARLPVSVELGPDVMSGTLRLHYTPAGDGVDANDYLSWPHVDYEAPVTASGEYVIALDGLDTDVAFIYRHVLVVGEKHYATLQSGTFATADFNTPSRFSWVGGTWWQNTDNNWNDPGIWKNLDNRPRLIPGVAGDTVYMMAEPVQSRTYMLTNSVTIGSLFTGHNDHTHGIINFYSRTPAGTPVTLTFDSGNDSASILDILRVPTLRFGEYLNSVRHDDLRVHLAGPLSIVRARGDAGIITFHSPISGGTEESPVPITAGLRNLGWGARLEIFLANTNNTFRGDITLVSSGGNPVFLDLGVNYHWMAANTWYNADDRMLGDTRNKVILRNNAGFQFLNNNDTFVLNRTVLGTGHIRSIVFRGDNALYDTGNVTRKTLRLGARAVLSPGEGDDPGTLTLWGSGLVVDPGAKLNVKLQPNGVCDTFVLDIPGDIRLNGARVIIDDSALAAVPREPNAEWIIVTAAASSTFYGNFRSTPGYTVHHGTHPETGAPTLVIRRQTNFFILR